MQRILVGLAVVAACGGSGGGPGDGSTGDGSTGDGAGIDAPPVGTPLVDRISVATIATPAGVMAGDSNWRIWNRGSLRTAPVFTVPFADCGTLVGYTTGTSTPTARVARLGPSDALIETYDLGPFELRGLAAEPDGHFAALLWDAAASPKTLRVTRYDATGANPRITMLADTIGEPTDFGIGESRLEFGGGKYGAYFHVHGISGNFTGHEGDALKWVDAASGALTTGWSWGCSHSMSELLRYEPGTNKFLSACVTDCYPGTSGAFATNSIGGVYLDKSRKVLDVDGGCNGSVAGELGSLVPHPTGWKLVWNSHQNAATLGQGSYTAATMNQDIAFASVGTNGSPTGAVVWLTTTPGNEQNASVARWQPDGDDAELYVVGWAETATATRTYKLAVVAADGAFVEAPADVTATVQWGERDDPFRNHLGGDVVWAWFDAAGATSFELARVHTGRSAQCAAL